jgi:hypothetical protein
MRFSRSYPMLQCRDAASRLEVKFLEELPPGEHRWAAQDDRKFEQRLRDGRFDVQVRRPRGRLNKGGPRHTIFLSYKS